MKQNYILLVLFVFCSIAAQAQVANTTWKIAPMAGSLAVGPNPGSSDWWAIDDQGVMDRACYFDDTYVFMADGTFKNELGTDTWIEGWQGIAADGCGTPVAPHDGSVAATWSFDTVAMEITISGTGAYIGLPKVHNAGELTDPSQAVASITYPVAFTGDSVMTIDINFGGGYWRYVLNKVTSTSTDDVVLSQEAFDIFPNPATSQFTLSFDEALPTSAMMSIFDFQGRLVQQEVIRDQQTVISTADLNTGLYIVRVDAEDKSYVQKLSVAK